MHTLVFRYQKHTRQVTILNLWQVEILKFTEYDQHFFYFYFTEISMASPQCRHAYILYIISEFHTL